MYINQSSPETANEYLKRINDHREFILILVKRGLRIKLKRTWAGVLWILINPIISISIYTLFFGFLMKVSWAEDSYLFYLFSGFCIWNLFSNISIQGGNALITNQEIIKKNPFPRISVIIAQALQNLIEQSPFILAICIAAIILRHPPLGQITLFPISLILTILLSFSVSLIIARLSLNKRDILHVSPYLFQIIIWFSPVFYPLNIIPESLQVYAYINPICGLLDMFRYSVHLQDTLSQAAIFSALSSLLYLLIAFFAFKNIDKNIPDYL